LELVRALEADLGGADNLSVAARQLVQRAAVLGTYIESVEVKWLRGEQIELLDLLAATNTQRRLLADLGLERRPRDVSPSLEQYTAALQARP
jgi:glutathione S-transferase